MWLPEADPIDPCLDLYRSISFYRYEIASKKSVGLTENQVTALNLLSGAKSPDGYRLICGDYGQGLFWWTSNTNRQDFYLVGNGANIRLDNIRAKEAYYPDNTPLVGWVK